jgi:hypothetical protein
MPEHSRLQAVADVSPARWVIAEIGPFGSGVGGLLPRGFDGYGRLLHPAATDADRPVRWAEVASWSGRIIHPRVQFGALTIPIRGSGGGIQPWADPPGTGAMPPTQLAALCEILALHTQSADHCWFCLWDGYGWIGDRQSSTTVSATRISCDGDIELQSDQSRLLPPEFPASIVNGPRVSLPQRDYFLLEGPLDAATELGWLLGGRSFVPQSPNLFWPDDRAWCVATEIDLDSTYIGGSSALIRDVLADDHLEALEVSIDDSVWANSDEVNR